MVESDHQHLKEELISLAIDANPLDTGHPFPRYRSVPFAITSFAGLGRIVFSRLIFVFNARLPGQALIEFETLSAEERIDESSRRLL